MTVKAICPDHPSVDQLLQCLNKLSNEQRERGMQLTLQGRLNESLIHLTLAIAANPLNPVLYLERSVINKRKSRYFEALDDIYQAVHLYKGGAETNIAYFKERISNHSLVILIELALKWYFSEQISLALGLANNLISSVPECFLLHLIKGDCLRKINANHEALRSYEKSMNLLELVDHSLLSDLIVKRICQTRLSLALSALADRRWEEAERQLETCLIHMPLVPEFHAIQGRIYFYIGKNDQAWEELLTCCYLLLSDWSLDQRTQGKWSQFPEEQKDRWISQLTTRLEYLTGPLLSHLTLCPLAVRQLANSEQCQRQARKIHRYIFEKRISVKHVPTFRAIRQFRRHSKGSSVRKFVNAPWPVFECSPSSLSSTRSRKSSDSKSLLLEKREIRAAMEKLRR
ncbi:hypothetical protein FBUS_01980 [Fasciolopsis buskii]|uniref:Tetratricopeptide repeat protein n=1 Tax=Fasciolopsis buskii TaxID=27845 RepID=A0A8E0S9W2_9TREM|nr:hypothetical protein FBUS_01980 [Fasciolopsis buski]